MKKQLFYGSVVGLFALFLLLLACSARSASLAGEKKEDALSLYEWRFIGRENAAGSDKIRLPALRVNFSADKISFAGGCNFFKSGINRVDEKTLKIGPVASTLKMCPPEKMRQDQHLSNFFNQATLTYAISQDGGKTKLILTNAAGERWIFRGTPRPQETRS